MYFFLKQITISNNVVPNVILSMSRLLSLLYRIVFKIEGGWSYRSIIFSSAVTGLLQTFHPKNILVYYNYYEGYFNVKNVYHLS